jgi:S-adenosylmethionine:tRNA ribosyltransferase-isomerase
VNVEDFDYELPPDRIAQHPLPRRDRARLLVLERDGGAIAHRRFDELGDLLDPGDLLVLNDTRVLPARLIGRKETGGRVEILLVERAESTLEAATWYCLLQAGRRTSPGTRIALTGGLGAVVLGRRREQWLLRFEAPPDELESRLLEAGRMPLPPYIKRDDTAVPDLDDRLRYQTVFARRPGAIAAPTAGLHFTRELLERLGERDIEAAYLTLHVGLGTFQPVRVERVEEHRMHEEWCDLPEATAVAVDRVKQGGGRVVAVGTTVVRTLESRVRSDGSLRPGAERCDLFIYPGFRFSVIDALVTNFHLPRSTLLMLVAAFAGRERLLSAYAEAVDRGYRFYSYGDAMLIRSG